MQETRLLTNCRLSLVLGKTSKVMAHQIRSSRGSIGGFASGFLLQYVPDLCRVDALASGQELGAGTAQPIEVLGPSCSRFDLEVNSLSQPELSAMGFNPKDH